MSFFAANYALVAIRQLAPRHENPVNVVIAAEDIIPFTPISPGQLKMKAMPAGAAPEGALTDPAQAAGYAARTLLLSGDIIRAGHLTGSGKTENEVVSNLSVLADPNMRAVQVPLPEGFVLKPQDRIDIIYTEATRDIVNTRTAFRNVVVLQSLEKTAFLALNHIDAERLVNFMAKGTISYTLVPAFKGGS